MKTRRNSLNSKTLQKIPKNEHLKWNSNLNMNIDKKDSCRKYGWKVYYYFQKSNLIVRCKTVQLIISPQNIKNKSFPIIKKFEL